MLAVKDLEKIYIQEKTRKIQKIAYILQKKEKRIDVYEKFKKNLYKVQFDEQTFAQMLHKDIRNLYVNSISIFRILNNRKYYVNML